MPQQEPPPAPSPPSHSAPILEYAAPDPPFALKLRRLLNEKPGILAIIVLIALALGGYLLWALIMPPPSVLVDPPLYFYYTIDDGKTVFVDDHPPSEPFQKDGKDAVIAVVYTCDNNKTNFVHCLIKTTEEPFTPPGSTQTLTRRVSYIKKPGDTEWIPETNKREWAAIENSVKCPPGAGEPMLVMPPGIAVEVHSGNGGAK